MRKRCERSDSKMRERANKRFAGARRGFYSLVGVRSGLCVEDQ